MRVARRLVVEGLVQGVGFRYFVEDRARREGLHGWVRNRPDGSVEIEAEGEAEAMTRFEALVRVGPRAARVDRMTIEDRPPGGRETGFSIRG